MLFRWCWSSLEFKDIKAVKGTEKEKRHLRLYVLQSSSLKALIKNAVHDIFRFKKTFLIGYLLFVSKPRHCVHSERVNLPSDLWSQYFQKCLAHTLFREIRLTILLKAPNSLFFKMPFLLTKIGNSKNIVIYIRS